MGEDSVQIDGVLEVTILYLTSDDRAPVQAATEQVSSLPGGGQRRGEESVYQLNPGIEQLGAVMLGGDMVEIKGVITLDLLVLEQAKVPVITEIQSEPLDMQKLQQLPGIVGYIVQPEIHYGILRSGFTPPRKPLWLQMS